MTSRSTRNKIRHQSKKLLQRCREQIEHLAMIEKLAERQSGHINKSIRPLVTMVDMMEKVFIKFREGL